MNTLPHQQHDVNVVVMTDAGKLIFSRFDNTDDEEEDLSSFCGFVQAVSSTKNENQIANFYYFIFCI